MFKLIFVFISLMLSSPTGFSKTEEKNIVQKHFDKKAKVKKVKPIKLTDSVGLNKLLDDVYDLKDAKAFLKKVTVPDMAIEFKKAKSLSEANMIKFSGFYNGKIYFYDKKRKPWHVKFELDAAYTRGRVVGSHLIEVYDASMKLLKSTTGTPSFYKYKMFGYQTPDLLLDAMQGDGVFQVYRPPKIPQQLIGIFYEKTNSKLIPAGLVQLDRRN